jgi:Fe-S-cluster containining protein
MSIGLHLPEAIVLAHSLSEDLYAKVVEHAQRVFRYACNTPDYLAGYRHSVIGCCPFLDTHNGSCRIYEIRPANCRHVFSNMSPEYCAKDAMFMLEQNAQRRAEFLRQLDPHVNEDELPFIAPLEKIFSEKYQIYLMMLNAKYFNFIVLGEMSWFVVLAREYNLERLVTKATLAEFKESLQGTGFYHEHLLTDCQEILAHFKKQSVRINFADLA